MCELERVLGSDSVRSGAQGVMGIHGSKQTGRRLDIEDWYRSLQAGFSQKIAALDGKVPFSSEDWARPGGGGGVSMQLAGGSKIERASVNFSAVWGDTPAEMSESLPSASEHFYATGVSIIVHPVNPHAPTFHANIRFFSAGGLDWFGGGADLTPSYIYEDDARHFHMTLKETCDRHAVADYDTWKRECDEYFWLRHRSEARGIGGIFFDRLTKDHDEVWAFQKDLGTSLSAAYLPILEKRVLVPYGEDQRNWQAIRRGRYVEFNLVLDRGTRFGLDTGGRTESILGSLPPNARWEYPVLVDQGSHEDQTLSILQSPPRDWVIHS